jgi:hypothetical protein
MGYQKDKTLMFALHSFRPHYSFQTLQGMANIKEIPIWCLKNKTVGTP